MKNKQLYLEGAKDGIPIALGYLSVSFGFGVSAVSGGLSPLEAVLMSFTNLTSAGQMAGLTTIIDAGVGAVLALSTMLELALSQFIINARYFLMSLALSQKLSDEFTLPKRLLGAFGITDEIFGVASSKKNAISPQYLYGLILLPLIGWTLGTLLGAVAGSLLPLSLKNALGIAIYAMFVAIVTPQAKREHGVLFAAIISIAVSSLLEYAPIFKFITPGFAIIIAAVIAATAAAILFPVVDKEGEEA